MPDFQLSSLVLFCKHKLQVGKVEWRWQRHVWVRAPFNISHTSLAALTRTAASMRLDSEIMVCWKLPGCSEILGREWVSTSLCLMDWFSNVYSGGQLKILTCVTQYLNNVGYLWWLAERRLRQTWDLPGMGARHCVWCLLCSARPCQMKTVDTTSVLWCNGKIQYSRQSNVHRN